MASGQPTFTTRLDAMQPSQLYISAAKLGRVIEGFDPGRPESLGPLPVVRLGGRIVLTDGHTRAYAALLAGLEQVQVAWDEDELDRKAYEVCVRWCQEAGIRTVADLWGRVLPEDRYQVLWLDRCAAMHRRLEEGRGTRAGT